MKTTETRAAFVWTCDECGRDHFGRMIKPDISADEVGEAVRHTLGLEPYESLPDGAEDMDGWVMIPDAVTCPDCDVSYKTIEND